MLSPIEQNLTLLLPTHSFLPPELVHLSTSLLAQSRSKAASLKPDEEIARIYACCNIACVRLRHTLALEVGKVNPPTKPRVYAKLYAYLEGALKTSDSIIRTQSTPRKGWRQLKGVGSGSGVAKNRMDESTTPTASSKGQTHRAEFGVANADEELKLPNWVMPLLNQLCRALDAEGAAVHIYTGVQSALVCERQHTRRDLGVETPSKRRRISHNEAAVGIGMDQFPALLLAIYFHVSNRFQGKKLDFYYEARRMKGIEVMRTYLEKQKIGTVPVLPELQRDIEEDVDRLVRRCEAEWTSMEWYDNIPSAPALTYDDDVEDTTDGEIVVTPRKRPAKTPLRRAEKHARRPTNGDEDLGAAGLLPGLGTMFQPPIDWLSDDRRSDFEVWKRAMLKECRAVEAQV